MRVVLIGYRGSGKTSVGRILARRLRLAFVDADEELVRRAGRSIKDVFAADGEAHFRDLESTLLLELLGHEGVVLSLGGGGVLRSTNRAALLATNAARVYLRASAAVLHARIHADPLTAESRPALTHLGGDLDEIRTLLAAREPLYAAVATHTIDVDRASAQDVADAIARMLVPPSGSPDADEGEGRR